MVALAAIEGEEVGETALAYVNRLSDYLFVAARAANDFGKSDVLWAPRRQSERRRLSRPKAMSDKGNLETAIGVISGTSMDGIDVALIESDGQAGSRLDPPRPSPIRPRSPGACALWSRI